MKKWRVKKLSTALRQSLDDLRRVERMTKTYRVDMTDFHVPNGKCAAGARMVGLGADPKCDVGPGDFDNHTRLMMWAMDELRQGSVGNALGVLRTGSPWGYFDEHGLDRYHVDYEKNRPLWWKQMRKLQRDLEKAGL